MLGRGPQFPYDSSLGCHTQLGRIYAKELVHRVQYRAFPLKNGMDILKSLMKDSPTKDLVDIPDLDDETQTELDESGRAKQLLPAPSCNAL